MPFEFPNSPANGEYANGFVYNAANQTWDSAFAPRPATVPISSPNVIINGAFDIWQRGTSFTSSGYTADRWTHDFVTGAGTVSQQVFAPGTAPIADIEGTFFLRRNVTTGAQYSSLIQRIEDVRTFAGQTVTLSFWAKGTNPTGNFLVNLIQSFGSGGSAQVDNTAQSLVLTGSWTRYTFTFTLGSMSGKTIGTNSHLWLTIYQAAANTSVSTLDIWGVQMEAGAAATAFRRNAPSIQAELAACQRYYWQIGPSSSPVNYNGFALLQAPNTVVLVGQIRPPVPMRDVPSSIAWTGTTSNYAIYTGTGAISGSPTIAGDRTSKDSMWIQWSGSGFTAGAFYFLVGNNTPAAYFGFNAEL